MTDGQIELRWLKRAKAVAVFARKNESGPAKAARSDRICLFPRGGDLLVHRCGMGCRIILCFSWTREECLCFRCQKTHGSGAIRCA